MRNSRLEWRIAALLDQLTDAALALLARERTCPPAVLRFLLRRYATSGRTDLEAALGPALATALATPSAAIDAPEGLFLFITASTLSGDERVLAMAMTLADSVARGWPVPPGTTVATAMGAIESCLRAADLSPDEEEARRIVTCAIDELERVVVPLYRPGEGIGHLVGEAPDERERLDQIAAASALLAAYERTGRLPYSMLAEELMRFMLSTWPSAREPLAVSARAIGVFCRLAELRTDAAYLETAVVAPGADYAAEAESLVEALADADFDADPVGAAEYGLALCEFAVLGAGDDLK